MLEEESKFNDHYTEQLGLNAKGVNTFKHASIHCKAPCTYV